MEVTNFLETPAAGQATPWWCRLHGTNVAFSGCRAGLSYEIEKNHGLWWAATWR